MPFRRLFVLLVVVAVASSTQFGQNISPAQMVDLNVIAVDGRGQPVEDLSENDLQVTDNGKPQHIAFFRHNDNRSWTAPKLEAGESANRDASDIPYATVILFDMMNQSFDTRGRAFAELARSLGALTNADYLYLYLLTVDGTIYAVHAIPENGQETPNPGAPPWTSQIKSVMDAALKQVTVLRPPDEDVGLRVMVTYTALDQLGTQLAAIPGRKNIVWITDGVPSTLGPDFDLEKPLREMTRRFESFRVAIYPARQLMLGSPSNIGGYTGEGLGSQATVDELATLTGGRPNSGKDIGAAVRLAMQDVRSSYQLGYYPGPSNWDSKTHKLRITCRRKDVHLQTRTEYDAVPEPPASGMKDVVDSLVYKPFDVDEIGIRASSTVAADDSSRTIQVQLHIDAKDIVLAHEEGEYVGHLQIVTIKYFSGGRVEDEPPIALDVHYSPKEHDLVLTDGIPVVRTIPVDDQLKQVRFLVYDAASKTVGSITINITPNPGTKLR